jgi:hypothetical protein
LCGLDSLAFCISGAKRTLALAAGCSRVPPDRLYHRRAHAEGPVSIAILKENL